MAAALLRLVAAPSPSGRRRAWWSTGHVPSCGRHHGRPRLPGTGLDVSISHSGATVAVAVSSAGAVGVDVQQVAGDAVEDLSPLVLAESEAGHVAGARDFFTYWSRKEALVKATGDGIAVPLPEVVVTPPGTPPRLLDHPRPGGLAAQLRDLSPDLGYLGALAVLSPRPVVVRERSAERLLTAG